MYIGRVFGDDVFVDGNVDIVDIKLVYDAKQFLVAIKLKLPKNCIGFFQLVAFTECIPFK